MPITYEGRPKLYEGAVLATRERNYHDDSDFYAIVWDDAAGQLTTVEYASTRYGGGGNAVEDATPEVEAKAAAWLKRWWLARLKRAAVEESREVGKGKRVRVVRGRKVPIGTEGEVFWAGRQVGYRYRNWNRPPEWAYETRAGIILPDGSKVFLNAGNLKVVGARKHRRPMAEIEARAETRKTSWYAPFVMGTGLAVL